MSVSNPDARNRERARLSNLFERLSARVPLSNVHPGFPDVISSSRIQIPPIPEEFSTVLRNLSVIRTSCGSEARQSRTRRKTVAFTSSNSTEGDVISSQDNEVERGFDGFRLAEEKKYPFTFKHMIHKLYKRDDWLRTVKEVLEKSKEDFKPLAECALKQNPSEWMDPHIKFKVRGRESWRMSLTDKHGVNEPQVVRASKKRCVGIRKSTSGGPSGDWDQDISNKTKGSRKGSTFVFASTISSTERPGKEIYVHFPSPQVSPSDSCFSDAEQDSPVSPITPTSLYTTSCAAGMKRRVGMNHEIVVLNAVPPSRLTKRNLNKLSPRFSPQSA